MTDSSSGYRNYDFEEMNWIFSSSMSSKDSGKFSSSICHLSQATDTLLASLS